MAKILLKWTYYYDLIECPEYIANNLQFYQTEFDKWISNTDNKHDYWVINDEGELSLCFGSNAFVEWLNIFIIKEESEKCYIVKAEVVPSKNEVNLPKIYF